MSIFEERGITHLDLHGFKHQDAEPEIMQAKKLSRGRRTSLSITDLQVKVNISQYVVNI